MNIRKSIQKWSMYRQTVRELNSLDGRSLNDLGIARSDIHRIARQHSDVI